MVGFVSVSGVRISLSGASSGRQICVCSAEGGRGWRKSVAAVALATVLAVGSGQVCALADAILLPDAPARQLSSQENAVIQLFQRATPSVAYVTTYSEGRTPFSMNIMEIPSGTGSGFVWDTQGHIVTNFHVIKSAEAAKITLSNKEVFDAELVGYDADKDIAVLKINAKVEDLVPIKIGTSINLVVGQNTYAIGNPFGLDHTLTTGVISGLGREVKAFVIGRKRRSLIY